MDTDHKTQTQAFPTYSSARLARSIMVNGMKLPAGTRGTLVEDPIGGWYLVEISEPTNIYSNIRKLQGSRSKSRDAMARSTSSSAACRPPRTA